jgi:signal peptidase I
VLIFENFCQFYATGQQCHLDLESDLLESLMEDSVFTTAVVPRDTSYVLGDCGEVSVDSRVWGPLEDEKVIGRPILRLWPPARFGPIP